MEQQSNQGFHGNAYGVAGNVEGDQITKVFPHAPRLKPTGIPNNLPGATSSVFVGRENNLEELAQKLQQDKRVAIAAIAGMGGIGKSALALEYARQHLEDYPGGVCWLRVRGQELTSQIVGFAQAELGLKTPEELEGEPLVRWCWSHWQEGQVLLIFDDVAGHETIKPYLPPLDDRFRVVATTRERWRGMQRLDLDVLNEDAALELLRQLIGAERIDEQIEDARELCARLGYLPLALELVGGFLGEEEYWPLRLMLEELEQFGLTQDALVEADEFMTAKLGVTAAFELSWVRLPELAERAQELGCLLSGFGAAPIPWTLVEMAAGGENSKLLKQARSVLKKLNFLQEVAEDFLLLHPLMREFLQQKLEISQDLDRLKTGISKALVKLSKHLPDALTVEHVFVFSILVPHLVEVATQLLAWLRDEDLMWPFIGLGRFYKGQGLYELAVKWHEKCVEVTGEQLGHKHHAFSCSLNNLGHLYYSQGRYTQAEPLYQQALKLEQELYGKQNRNAATILNNLANLYRAQGHYEAAELLYQKSLALRQTLLGDKHSEIASSLNDLAGLYLSQGRHKQAEEFYQHAFQLYRELHGDKHPYTATSLNNLANLYQLQGRYEEAETFYIQALKLRQEIFGKKHPDVATSLNGLAALHHLQGYCEEAENLYVQALEIRQELLGNQHSDVIISLSNLAGLYHTQGRYKEAETLYIEALELSQELFGDKVPRIIATQNNIDFLRFEMKIHQLISNPQFQPVLEAWNAPTETKAFMEQYNSDPQLQKNVQELFQNLQQ